MDFEVFTTCHQCGKLLYIPQTTWKLLAQKSVAEEKNNDNSTKPYFPPSPLKRSCDVTINYNTNNDELIKQFQNARESLSYDRKTPFFPLCHDCTVTYLQHIQNYRKLFDAANDLIDKKFSNIPENVFNIQYQNAISPTKKFTNIKTASTSGSFSIYKENEDSTLSRNSFIDEICQDPFSCNHPNHKHYPILTKLPPKSKTFCPIMSCYTFTISHSRHYATINNLRVGFYKYDPNSILETNLGLYFITHLLYILKTAFNANGIRILLSPNPAISINNAEFQRLVIPEKKKHTNYDEINNAIHSLIIAFDIINEASFPQRKIATPYEVDAELRTIGSVSYDFNWKTVEDWTLAMRFLLHNLKMIQFRALRSCFYPG